ncbi:MAG: InlB B-repeat-containing protein [Clostridia bacterium]|nr:InlB B-repeat-containing protein [Clostridia bacterium]
MKICFDCARMIEDADGFCPFCGSDLKRNTEPREAYQLAPGTWLKSDRYLVGRALGYGGFGVTYAGFDAVLERRVAIKEYLPSEFATRTPGTVNVSVFGGDESEASYIKGLQSFVDESERLSKFRSIEGIVSIYDCFFENNTAYMVMELLDGRTVKAMLEEEGPQSFADTMNVIVPVLDALSQVHSKGIVHRDISPDNIFITNEGRVKLLDFGAARYATANVSKSLSVILKPGYAPPEQYRSRGNQGAWSDVYACAATMYKMLTGVTPEESLERASNDTLKAPSRLGADIPAGAETALLNALNTNIDCRTQTAEEFKNELLSTEVPRKDDKREMKPWALSRWVYAALAGVLLLGGVLAALLLSGVIDLKGSVSIDKIASGRKTVPDFVGLTEDEAKTRFGDWSFAITGSEETDAVDVGCIMAQDPRYGELVMPGTPINVTVNRGMASEQEEGVMPYLRGTDLNEANALLSGHAVDLIYEYDDTVSAGVIKGTDPDSGAALKPEQSVTLIVSRGGLLSDIELPFGSSIAMDADSDPLRISDIYKLVPANIDPAKVSVDVTNDGTEYSRIEDGYLIVDVEKLTDTAVQSITVAASMLNEDTGETVSIEKQVKVTVYIVRETVSDSPEPSDTASPEPETPEPTSTPVPEITVTPHTPATPSPTPGATPETWTPIPEPDIAVRFLGNGGTPESQTRWYYRGRKLGELPTVTRSGYSFGGWWTEAAGGTQVSSNTVVNNSFTVYAHWERIVTPIPHFTIRLDPNGGRVSPASIEAQYGQPIGSLPVPIRDYYGFAGWFTADGEQVHSSTVFNTTSDITLTARWNPNPVSGWVLYENMPSDAQIVEEKWTYTKTTTIESYETSMEGFDRIGGRWVEADRGSFNYSNEFPSGFDTSHSLYSAYNVQPRTDYETETEKQTVSNTHKGYIYWHWMYDVSYANTTTRAISSRRGFWDYNGGQSSSAFNYKYFTAIASTADCPYLDNYYCCSQNLPSYYCHSIITDTTHVGTPRMFRFKYYECSWTRYRMLFTYQKVEDLTSYSPVSPSSTITNVQHWVRYRAR